MTHLPVDVRTAALIEVTGIGVSIPTLLLMTRKSASPSITSSTEGSGTSPRPFRVSWNCTGHRVIASIAYRQLDEQTKRKIAELLKKHPADVDLWVNRQTSGSDEVLNLFWNASVFPDDARSEPWRRYGLSLAHYVNHRIQGNKVEPPAKGENVLNSYVAHLKQLQSPGPRSRTRRCTYPGSSTRRAKFTSLSTPSPSSR